MPLPGPDARVVEIRVAGLVGTTGEALLDATAAVDVAGDGIGQFTRPADRLRRPAPGPVLQALGRTVPRILEGYLWSRMTSGGVAKATWALLFPFSLANVAHWMLPPVPERSRVARVLAAVCRSLLRVASLALTMLLISQVAVITLDLVAAQCLAPNTGCLDWAPSWSRESPVARLSAGLLPLLVLIFLLHLISSTNWPVEPSKPVDAIGDPLPGDDLRTSPDTPLLRCLHTLSALACVALLPLGGPLRPPSDAFGAALWGVAVGLIALGLILVAVLDVRVLTRAIGRWTQRLVLGLGLALVVAVVVQVREMPQALPGTQGMVEVIGSGLLVVVVLFALLLIPAALVARRGWSALPRRLRPWMGGWAAAPALALAGLLGGGFGAGVAIAARKLLGTDDLVLPRGYTLLTMVWGVGIVVAAALAVFGFAGAVPRRRRKRGVPKVVEMLQDKPEDSEEAAAAWARSAWERRRLHQLVLAVVLVMSAATLALLTVRIGDLPLPTWLDPLSALGVFALGALAAGLLRVVYTAATSPERSRHLGALADLVCFWPRAAHPTVPPCYALKVVPELAARTRTHLAEPNTRVVLAGYNLGGLLAVVTAARLMRELPEADRSRVGVLTAGSPLQWGYQRAFPAVLPHKTLARLFGRLDGRWRGLSRGTDTFGGGVTTWRHEVKDGKLHGVGYLPDGTVGPLVPAECGNSGAVVLGGDHWLPDPLRAPSPGHRWAPGVCRHADYLADPEWDRAVACAAGLEIPGKPMRPAAEQFPLFGDLPPVERPRFKLDLRHSPN
ncbi:hypothetical protein [Amycolatopsis sp. YIM 10]|uniref:hypothetical protein n=1 Tax=Amycolatopsis sp. YIM 10 TaxID=2653857 RepID=UPI0012902012|nr:hypothetical protein [Amycolatopsis sp. YIM 10]QFU86321.1 hypothetical protein YIM_05515 [Amycolatopsis sp. YIM 10]